MWISTSLLDDLLTYSTSPHRVVDRWITARSHAVFVYADFAHAVT
jgi:hypothetical protein